MIVAAGNLPIVASLAVNVGASTLGGAILGQTILPETSTIGVWISEDNGLDLAAC